MIVDLFNFIAFLQWRVQQIPSSPPVIIQDNTLQAAFTQSVYEYAGIVYSKSDSPHQNKLDHDVQNILGSSDPPPGFGFLHPKVYYLTQSRPIPMEPLRVCISFLFFVFLFLLKRNNSEIEKESRKINSHWNVDHLLACFFSYFFRFFQIYI